MLTAIALASEITQREFLELIETIIVYKFQEREERRLSKCWD